MNFLRKHWFDLGAVLSLIVGIYIFNSYHSLSQYQFLLWCSLITLFFHQLEEYRIVGTFPGMINTVMFKSETPDRFPLNTNTALIINIIIGWGFYLPAAILSEKAIWLGIATMMVSMGNIIAHTFLFNIKGKTFYNAGLITCWLFFAPAVYYFIIIITNGHLASASDWYIGIILGVVLNYIGVLKMISWMADKNTPFVFEQRNLLKKDRL